MITSEKIFAQTRGGLDIILDLFPEASVCLENPRAKFRKRGSERTPSAHLIQKDHVWYVKDFGETGKGLNGIRLWMEAHFMDVDRFGEACMAIAKQFGITDELDRNVNMPEFRKRAATSEEPDGEMQFRLKEKFSQEELRLLGPHVTQGTVDALHWYSAEWVGKPKDRKITEKHSTNTYPIFIRECVVEEAHGDQPEKKFYKLYEPKNTEKGFRFQYFPIGAKEPDYINGLHELQKAHAKYVEQARLEWEATHKDSEPFMESQCKLKEVVICSGERDALCVRSHGYHPVWLNSETASLSGRQMDVLRRYAETIYNIPDMDATGIKAATELAKRHIDIYTVWLPQRTMGRYTDHRGKPLKDLRDWSELRPTKSDFRDLLLKGKPAKFWTEKTDKNGYRRYDIDTEYLFHFLQLHGFYILRDDNAKDPRFIRIENNIVKSVTTRDIRSFVRRWATAEDTTQHHHVRNLILNTPRLSPSALEALQEIDLDFTSATPSTQMFFFRNGTVNVSPDKIEFFNRKQNPLEQYVWQENVLNHDYRELPPMFAYSVENGEDSEPELSFSVSDCQTSHFFGYLINSSRLYWRKEMEYPFSTLEEREAYRQQHLFDIAGAGLLPAEHQEQLQNLMSKLFALGYILHQYKSPDRAWALMAMDSKIGENDQANGRSGKSFFYVFLERLRRTVQMSGRSGDLTKNPHWLDRVNQFTQVLQIDDLDERMPASFFYDNITGAMTVNPKNNQSFTIPFSQSPKLGFTTNYVPSDFDPSSEARMIYMVYSDYYHQRTEDNDYLETRSIRDDFGKALYMEDYTEEEWNADFNFVLQCERFYLWLKKHFPALKLQPPMANIKTRKLKRDMGENFEEWAYQYFAEDSEHLDCQLVRTEVFDDFKRYSNLSNVKMKGFTRKLRAFAVLCPYIHEMDPEEFRNSQGRNVVSQNMGDPLNPQKTKTVEMLYMRSVKAEQERLKTINEYGAEPF